jgi:iron complex transport system substrate-binding protein
VPSSISIAARVAACFVFAACSVERREPAVSTTDPVVVDDFGDTVAVGPALRIVSLNPVSTELLFAAGGASRLVGRTHWDLYPEGAAAIPDLGNGVGPNVEAVIGARPDLVILYASTSNRRAAETLQAAGVRTLSIRTDHLSDLARLAEVYGRVTGDTMPRLVADSARRTVDSVRALPRPVNPPRLVWRQGEPPIYVAGRGSFQGELIEVAGGVNAFADVEAPSPQVSIEEIVRREPSAILTGPEGAARVRASATWRALAAVRAGRILVVDTALVGRPGVRMGEAAQHLRLLITTP